MTLSNLAKKAHALLDTVWSHTGPSAPPYTLITDAHAAIDDLVAEFNAQLEKSRAFTSFAQQLDGRESREERAVRLAKTYWITKGVNFDKSVHDWFTHLTDITVEAWLAVADAAYVGPCESQSPSVDVEKVKEALSQMRRNRFTKAVSLLGEALGEGK